MKIKLMQPVCAGLLFAASMSAVAASSMTVNRVKVEGLQRIQYATVMNAVHVPLGKPLSELGSAQVIRDIYHTGFFNFVELSQDGNTLIIHVMERATIGDVIVTGNHQIPKDQFHTVLKQLALVRGEVFDNSVLDEMKRELKELYNAHGKYNATITSTITTMPRNRVGVRVEISEGKVAKIKDITLIGNHAFSNTELMKQFELTSSGLFTFFTQKDQYAKEKLNASLQAVQSYYMDRGYLHMRIQSVVVSLSPDRSHVFITIKIIEGDKYTFSGFRVVGRTIVPLQKVEGLIHIKNGDVFARNKVTDAVSAIGDQLGEVGYGFPTINAEPQINERDKTVYLTFKVDAGVRVYVRRIGYEGNTRTADYVLRHGMRQPEASLLNVAKVKESERQLRLLGYLKNVSVQTKPVPGTTNQVDLNYKVEEDHSAEATFSVGYGTNGFLVNTGYNEKNFMGSGKSLGVNASRDKFLQEYKLSYFNPYFSDKGIGAGYSLYYSKVKPDNFGIGYNANRVGADLNFSSELSDTDVLYYGLGYTHLKVNTLREVKPIYNKKGELVRYEYPVVAYLKFSDLYGSVFNQLNVNANWMHIGLDQTIFPTKGYGHRLGGSLSFPINGGLRYYKAEYTGHAYVPLGHDFILSLRGVAGYGNGYGSTEGLPFFENFYAGGAGITGQIRGYDPYSVGPIAIKSGVDGKPIPLASDADPSRLGGNVLLGGTAALILPYPLSQETVRTSVFFDAGNVYQKGIPELFKGRESGPVRKSTGLSVIWRSPFGAIEVGYARPLNKQKYDETQRLFFTIHASPL